MRPTRGRWTRRPGGPHSTERAPRASARPSAVRGRSAAPGGREDRAGVRDRQTRPLDEAARLDTKRRAFLGSQLRTIRAANYDPQLWAIEIRAAQRAGALDDENADRLIGITDPTQIKALTDQYIAQAGGEALKPPTVGSVEDYVTRYAASLGKAPEALTPADITTAIGQFQAANRAPAAASAPPAVGSFSVTFFGGSAPRRPSNKLRRRGKTISRRTTGRADGRVAGPSDAT